MKLATPVLLVSLFLPSCILAIGDGFDDWSDDTTFTSRADEVRRENRRNLDQLRLGMNRNDVDEVLGTESKWVSNAIGWVDNPYRTSSYRDGEGREEWLEVRVAEDAPFTVGLQLPRREFLLPRGR